MDMYDPPIKEAIPTAYPPEYFKVVTPETKQIFFWIFIIICVVSVIGNVLAIKSIIYRKSKVLQKTCIISLALSDLLSVFAFTTTTMHTFTNELMIWTLGKALCYLLPTFQLFGTTMSSVALLVIAFDRYLNVIHALSKQWDPNIYQCLFGALGLWILFGLVTHPMYIFFQYETTKLIYPDNSTKVVYFCISPKESVKSFQLVLTVVIFVPLLLVFLWFYFNIAKLIWNHRKPISDSYVINESSENDTANTNNVNSTTNIQVPKKTKKPVKKDMQMERKIRTFKIILVLMFVFIICRLPYWAYLDFKLFYVFPEEMTNSERSFYWNMHYGFMALNLTNCALNPFLYTFLNQTVEFLKKFSRNACRICFVDFEEFENENPFIMEQNNKNNKPADKQPHPKY